jgi:hypothetical protein
MPRTMSISYQIPYQCAKLLNFHLSGKGKGQTKMPLLGFSVFKDKILNGEKRQTIRKARKIPINIGDTLYLYWKLRTKQCELLKVVKCTESLRVKFSEFCDDENVARKDGFESAAQMREWFEKHYDPKPRDLFDVIRW